MSNPFYPNIGPFDISEILKSLKSKSKLDKNTKVKDISDLLNAKEDYITFFHSKKYQELAKKPKHLIVLLLKSLKDYLPENCKPIIVENVLVSTATITQKFYPNSVEDEYDNTVIDINKSEFAQTTNAGKNVL